MNRPWTLYVRFTRDRHGDPLAIVEGLGGGMELSQVDIERLSATLARIQSDAVRLVGSRLVDSGYRSFEYDVSYTSFARVPV